MKSHFVFRFGALLQRLSGLLLLCVCALPSFAQRVNTPLLDRSLVAVPTNDGVFCSWRIPGVEYYDVEYNIYRDGVKINPSPLSVSNFLDKQGSLLSRYSVAPVVCGVEGKPCDAVAVWKDRYIEIAPKHDGHDVYEPNDATAADLDGDGQLELIVKFRNLSFCQADYPLDATEFDILEAYKLDGTRLWWIDCGPNMIDFQSTEINIAAYDWDGDGRAECILRLADGAVLHLADGSTHVVGHPDIDTRPDIVHKNFMQFSHTGYEYLLYLDGLTGRPYQEIEFPLRRLEKEEYPYNIGDSAYVLADYHEALRLAWGDAYGHRLSKFFFGAPYLDGRRPSIFLARGIYSQHKMMALDVDPKTHKLVERWRWYNKATGPWVGQGYHNFSIADVDWDGRDEIVYGSMVIDDNGLGLSTTGLGHGDAHHVGDFNPYVHGSEIFACNEDAPANNYRDATTSRIYYRLAGGGDDGRAMCGNFSNDVVGAIALSGHDKGISCVAAKNLGISDLGLHTVFRIYWDGDLCEETFGASKLWNGVIGKHGVGYVVDEFVGGLTINGSKSNPCLQADILGDWREEVVLRTIDGKIRIYTSSIESPWRVYSLLDDHQYRNAIVHQMNGYNQPPHLSYFLGELEGITTPPPPLISAGRVEAARKLSSSLNGKHVLISKTADAAYVVGSNFSPSTLTVVTPSWVQGRGHNDSIRYESFSHTLSGRGFVGNMRLVKQGDGRLVLPSTAHSHSGPTNVWAGELVCDGQMLESPVWLNRFAKLSSNGGAFRSVEVEYDALVDIGGAVPGASSVSIDSLALNFGGAVLFDLFADGSADCLNVKNLVLRKAPCDKFDVLPVTTPVFRFAPHTANGEEFLPGGRYLIGHVEHLEGDLSSVVVEGPNSNMLSLLYEDGNLYAVQPSLRKPSTLFWTGAQSNSWDVGRSLNFVDVDGNAAYFVPGDHVVFDDRAKRDSVHIDTPVRPASVSFDNSSVNYVLMGDSIVGHCMLQKSGSASLQVDNVNRHLGGTFLRNGILAASQFCHVEGAQYGAFGGVGQRIVISGGTLASKGKTHCSNVISFVADGSFAVEGDLYLTHGVVADSLTSWHKRGKGTLWLAQHANGGQAHVHDGRMWNGEESCCHTAPHTIVLEGGGIADLNNVYSFSLNRARIVVPEGQRGSWQRDRRCEYVGRVEGTGTLDLRAAGVRDVISADMSNFAGNINFTGRDVLFLNSFGLARANVSVRTLFLVSAPSSPGFEQRSYDVEFGALSGNGILDCARGGSTFTVGALGTDCTFDGIAQGGRFVKIGGGCFTLTAPQLKLDSAAVVEVRSGVLKLLPKENKDFFFGNNCLKVYERASLSGSASLQALVVDGGSIVFNISSENATQPVFSFGNGVALSKASFVVNLPDDFSPKAGDSFLLWQGSLGSDVSGVQFVLPDLPKSLMWSLPNLGASVGKLSIVRR